jgi:ABC-2 type transport system ATP-binding protein
MTPTRTFLSLVNDEGQKKRYKRHEALRGVDLAVPAGTVLGLPGPNGAGKPTTVGILAALLPRHRHRLRRRPTALAARADELLRRH